jgi:hypothetical protein
VAHYLWLVAISSSAPLPSPYHPPMEAQVPLIAFGLFCLFLVVVLVIVNLL